MERYFTKEDTSILKGIAIMCMLFHHTVSNVCYLPFYLVENLTFLSLIASTGKVCVALLTILSGYGLCESYNKRKNTTLKNTLLWVVSRFVQLFSMYWAVNIVFFIANTINLLATNQVNQISAKYIVIGTLGLHRFVGDWYLVAIFILYAIFSILHICVKKLGIAFLVLSYTPWILFLVKDIFSFSIKYDNVVFYIGSFSIGIYLSMHSKLTAWKNSNNKRIAITLFIVVLLLRQILTLSVDCFLALSIIYLVLNIQVYAHIQRLLISFGRQSSNMWLIHARIIVLIEQLLKQSWYTELLLFFLLFIISFSISWIINTCKTKTKYNLLIKKLRSFIENI